ncbi:hypothetical protein I4U23_027788 [Adineta vaga]|nr:hypothetical protein I4U23_027788 [Adineta vaga]
MMGSTSSFSTSMLSIHLLNGHDTVYEPEEDLNGTVQFITDIHLIDDILIQFTGELVYTSYERKGQSTITTNRQVPFLVRTIHHKTSEKNQYQFSFQLNSSLPASFEQLNPQGPYIHYFLRIRSLNHQFKQDFPILIKRPTQILLGHVQQIQNQPLNNVQVNVTLENNLGLIGQNLPFQIDLHNPNSRTIDRISLKLIQIRKLGPVKEERTVLLKEDLIHFDKFKGEHYNGKFHINIPYEINPTCSYHLPNQWFIFVHYELYIKVHRRGFSKNPSLSIPILINYQNDLTSLPKSDSILLDTPHSQSLS